MDAARGIACCLLGVLGCVQQPDVIVDTSGAAFGWDCGRGGCMLELLPETPPPTPCPEVYTPIYSYAWGRFFEIVSACAHDGMWSSTVEQGRYLRCDDDSDCPRLDVNDSPDIYECSAGLCQNVDVERYPRDELRRGQVDVLCIAELSRDEIQFVPDELEQLLDAHCGADPRDLCPLPLPEPCWQP